MLSDLRKEWQQWLLEKHILARLAQHVATHCENPLFTEDETAWLQQSFKRFSDKHSTSQDWDFSVPPGQPYCLSALSRLSHLIADKDTSLFPALMQGVPTGFDKDIPRSHTLRPRRETDSDEGHELLICEGNWKGAEEDPALLQQLIEEELAAGYLEVIPDLETAFRRWGKERVAVGKVNIVKAPGRSPRLVVDNSICNTNHCCHVPEQFSMPSLQDIQASFPLREDNEEVQGFSLDVKGAHKTSRVREQDILVSWAYASRNVCFFTRSAPFGATFSSHWFARLGGFFTRCLHLLIWLAHVLLLYVDDLLLFQNSKVLPLSSALTLAFGACFKIPLSWKKLQMGQTITWIGWEINLSSACFSLPEEAKRNKLYELVSECLRHRQVSRKQLDKLLGLLQWILHGMPTLRPWLSSLYDDMHRPLGTNVSINPTLWAGIGSHLDEELRFTSPPPGTAISKGAKLLSARHFDMHTKADLVKVPVSTQRIWMRVADPTSSRRKLCPDSVDVLRFFQHLSSVEWRPRPLRPPALVAMESAADAFGKGDQCGIGGWLRFPSGRTIWFSQLFDVQQFTALGIPVQSDANLDISSYETLAQCFVLLAFWKCSGAGRLVLPALSDNSGAEAVCNKLYTSKVPLNLFVRKLCMWSALSGVSLECSHIAGEKNDDADFLSQWNGDASTLPSRFRSEDRFSVDLPASWNVAFSVSLFPQHAKLLWKLPASYTLGPSSAKPAKQL